MGIKAALQQFKKKVKSPGNGAGSRVVKEDDDVVYEDPKNKAGDQYRKPPMKPGDNDLDAYATRPGRSIPYNKARKDINLPDEKKNLVIGKLKSVSESKAPYKKEWERRRKAGETYDGMKFDKEGIKEIRGGDPDDPRWEEHKKRTKGGTGIGSRVVR